MKIKLKINLIIGISCGLTPLFCTSCSNGSSIVFSNFESYMSEDIMNSMHKKYNVSFQYYSTNEDIQNKFKKYYDVSVPSLYETIVLLQYDELSQIDWNYFSSLSSDGLNDIKGNQIKNGNDAIRLLSKTARQCINVCNEYINDNNIWPKNYAPSYNKTILDFCIPYFISEMEFGYKGNLISGLSNDSSWSDIVSYTAKNGSNFDERFAPSTKQKLCLVDDERTIYSLSQAIATKDNDSPTINPLSKNQSISSYKNTMSNFLQPYKNQGQFLINSDSQELVNNYSQDNLSQGIISYNGDIGYAGVGAGDNNSFNETLKKWKGISSDESTWPLHCVDPAISETAMDVIVINKKNDKKISKKHSIENMIYDIQLEHMGWSSSGGDDSFDINSIDSIAYQKNNEYFYNPMKNFDLLVYYSPFEKIKEFSVDTSYDGSTKKHNNYFYDWLNNYGDYDSLCEYLIGVLNITKTDDQMKGCIDTPITDLDKTNMHWAYMEWRQNL